MIWKGAYSDSITYNKDEAVGYNGASYFCVADGTVGITPVISISLARSLSIGSVTVNAAWTVIPSCCTSEVTCTWYNPQGEVVSNNELLTINNVNASNSGVYTALVSMEQMGGYTATSETETITIGNATYKTLYIHDLRPGRDAGYIWMGWWVHDEIKKAQADGFDWMADPTNSRFKYKAYLATLIQGFGIWADLDMQESRNGYILHKKDVIV